LQPLWNFAAVVPPRATFAQLADGPGSARLPRRKTDADKQWIVGSQIVVALGHCDGGPDAKGGVKGFAVAKADKKVKANA
jgi:hypothetical protein